MPVHLRSWLASGCGLGSMPSATGLCGLQYVQPRPLLLENFHELGHCLVGKCVVVAACGQDRECALCIWQHHCTALLSTQLPCYKQTTALEQT